MALGSLQAPQSLLLRKAPCQMFQFECWTHCCAVQMLCVSEYLPNGDLKGVWL